MKKQLLLCILLFLFSATLFAQNFGINADSSAPDASAMLDVKSTNKGVLISRIALTGTTDVSTISSPQVSLLIYNTATTGSGTTAVTPGFYFWAGSQWLRFSLTGTTALSPWLLGGNTGTNAATNFIGTTDNQPLVFKVNNQKAGRIDYADGPANTAFGYQTHNSNTGWFSTAFGYQALYSNTSAWYNTAFGYRSLFLNTTGSNNTGIGQSSLESNVTGNNNTATGRYALVNTKSSDNTATGFQSLGNNQTGSGNTAVGSSTLGLNTTGSNNTAIGFFSNVNANNLSNATAIGAKSRVDCDNCLVLGSVNGINTATSNVSVGVGTTNPNASSVLDLTSTSKGLLVPRMTQAQRDAVSTPATGLMIYQTDGTAGFYYYDGSIWSAAKSNTNNLWSVNGNTGTDAATNFIGTTDNQPLVFKINNQLAGKLAFSDNTSYGLNTLVNSTGTLNTATGTSAMENNTTGSRNAALGAFALRNNSIGFDNTAVGWRALNLNTSGGQNSALGQDALRSTTTGTTNTAVGASSLSFNTTGSHNTAIGYVSLLQNSTGIYNSGLGDNTLFSNSTGSYNTAVGYRALKSNSTGTNNTVVGTDADVTGNVNYATAIGYRATAACDNCLVLGSVAGANSATSNVNVGIGTTNPNSSAVLDLTSNAKGLLIPRMTQSQRDAVSTPATGLMIYQTDGTAGFYFYNGSAWTTVGGGNTANLWSINGNAGTNPTTNFIGTTDSQPLVFKVNNQLAGKIGGANYNTFMGARSGINTTGIQNTAFGSDALLLNTTGEVNSATGESSLKNNTTGTGNTANGAIALPYNTTGGYNTAAGFSSLFNNTNGTENTALGSRTLSTNIAGNNNTAIGANADVTADGLSNTTAIGAKATVGCSDCMVLGSVNGVNNATSTVRVGIGTTNPSSSSLLDLTSTSKGLLIPRMTQSQRDAVSSPSTGLMIYQTDATAGFYYYNGSSWTSVAGTVNTSNLWSTNGNTGTNPSANFIGTTDDQPLILKVNNIQAGKISSADNTFIGYQSGVANTTGYKNTSLGKNVLSANTSGNSNIAIGSGALSANTTGNANTALGSDALLNNTTGEVNIAIGASSMRNNQGGNYNIAIGLESLLNNATGFNNTAIGTSAMVNNTAGTWNTVVGVGVLRSNTTGYSNTAMGANAMALNIGGAYNTAIGDAALNANQHGTANTAIGLQALLHNISGSDNTATGHNALYNSIGSYNTAYGTGALYTNSAGNNNTALGVAADVSAGNLSNATAIGFGTIVDASNKVRIGNAAVTVIEGQVPFTTPSDARYKYNVQEDVKGLDFILKLRPVTYQFDGKKLDTEMQPAGFKNANYTMQASYNEAAAIRRTGFIAQEVEKAAGASGYNFSGVIKPQSVKDHYGLSYESFVVPLVKAIQEQQSQIETLKKENEELKKLKQQIEVLSKAVETLSANK